MKHFNCWQVFVAGLAMVAGAWVAQPFAVTAEIELRATCKCNSDIVRLKDVAEIHAADDAEADLLGDLELFPTPQDGRHRTLRARQLQDILALSGLDLSAHRLSGSSQVEVTNESRIVPVAASRSAAVSRLAFQRACESVRKAILAYLNDQVSPAEAWEVDVELDASQVQRLIVAGDSLTVTGGAEPWLGEQEFELTYGAADHAESIAVVVEVSRRPAVVVCTHALRPGALIGEADVELQSIPEARRGTAETDDAFTSIEEILGLETLRAIPKGSFLTAQDVRSPILVRRGDAVSVLVRRTGVTVRTTGRAKTDGSRGDSIVVESLINKQSFLAVVTGIQEVDVPAAGEAQPEGEREAGSPKLARRHPSNSSRARRTASRSLPVVSRPREMP